MRQSVLIMLGVFALTACVSEQEQREAAYRQEQVLRNQCEHVLGFQSGTQGYMNCRMFYDKVIQYALGSGTTSFSRVQTIQNRIASSTQICQNYWGRSNMNKTALWSCIQQREQEMIDEAIHQKELQEQEDMLTRSIAAGQKEANDDNRLQERIDAERERVAKATGKNPKKIKCKTYNKSNGYIQVKCK